MSIVISLLYRYYPTAHQHPPFNMDEDEQMELALNSNFDSELFDCWDDGDEDMSNSNNNGDGDAKRASERQGSRRSSNRAGDNDKYDLDRSDAGETRVEDDPCWASPEAFEHFSRLPSFSMDNDYDGRRTDLDDNDVAASESAEPSARPIEMNKATKATKSNAAKHAAGGALVGRPPPSAVVSSYSSNASTSESSGPGKSTLSSDSSSSSSTPHPSDASVPRPSASPSGPGGHDAATQMHPLGTLSSAKCPALPASGAATANHHSHSAAAVPADLHGAAFYPLALSALAAGAAAAAANANCMNRQYLLDAVNNANNHAVAAAAVAAIIGNPHHNHSQQQQSRSGQQSSADPDSANAGGINTQQQRMPPSEAAAAGHSGGAGGSSGRDTPVMSFDAAAAPIELRTNFENSMRAHGMLDANSVPFSFGVSVNGFHPQQGMMMGSASSSVTGDTSAAASRLGAGLCGGGEKRLKNAKEQVRAQKIAELIDELREKMQKSGWSVGVSKSKFNTLSSYV